MYKVNDKGRSRSKFVKKEALKILIVGPLLCFALGYMSYTNMQEWPEFRYFSIPLYILIYLFFFIFVPINMLRNHNNTIEEIGIMDKTITIKTFKALWMKKKLTNIELGKLKISKTKFNRYGKKEKDGYIIKYGKYEEYYLVNDYFTENENIIANITY